MTRAQRSGRIALVALLVLATSLGCSKATDESSEQGRDQEIVGDDDGDANVDLSDGNIEVSDGDGGTVEIDAGENAALPEGFPSDLEVPRTTNIIQASNSTAEGNQIQLVTLQFEGPVAEVYDAYKAQLEAAGYEIASDSSGSDTGSDFGNAVATKGSTTVNATFGGDGAGSGTASISVQMK